jgi:HSP20 family protein
MAKDKRSFFERLTGTIRTDDLEDDDPYEHDTQKSIPGMTPAMSAPAGAGSWASDEEIEGELAVDVYQTPDEIIVKTMVAGVRPEDLDISISRDMITVKGKREGARTVSDEDYFFKELYWGSFSRTILLPQEIEVEAAEAISKHGLLIIKLPKVDKQKQTKLRVKTG